MEKKNNPKSSIGQDVSKESSFSDTSDRKFKEASDSSHVVDCTGVKLIKQAKDDLAK